MGKQGCMSKCNFSTRYRWKDTDRYTWNRRLGEPHSQSGSVSDMNNLSHKESNHDFSTVPTRSIVNIPAVLSCLSLKLEITLFYWGAQWRSWLRHCATSQKVAGSILDGVVGIFHWHNPSGHSMALGSTQPLTEMSTRSISWGIETAGP